MFLATNICPDRFCRDKNMFVATKLCHTFVATKDVFCHDKHVFVATKMILVAAPASDMGEGSALSTQVPHLSSHALNPSVVWCCLGWWNARTLIPVFRLI